MIFQKDFFYVFFYRKCSAQLNRANIFCTQKVNYFANKYSIKLSNDLMNELTLIVKYFYLYVLCKFHRKIIKY